VFNVSDDEDGQQHTGRYLSTRGRVAKTVSVSVPGAQGRYLTGAGLARLSRSSFAARLFPKLGLTLDSALVHLRARTRKQPGLPGTQHAVAAYRRETRLRLNAPSERAARSSVAPLPRAPFAEWT
jgi:hypothetical protein